MRVTRRRFLQGVLAAELAHVTGLAPEALAKAGPDELFGFRPVGNLTLLFVTDLHAHLRPIYFREPSVNMGPPGMADVPGHLGGAAALRYWGIKPGAVDAYFASSVEFEELARRYGRMGGVAHIATLVKRVRAERGGRVLLLDGGDTWQGTGVGLLTRGKAVVEAQNLLGFDAMTPHWEFTYGKEDTLNRIGELSADFVAHNVADDVWGEPVFKPYTIKETQDLRVGVIGQAFPYTPIAHPRELVEGWTFGIKEDRVQQLVDELRGKKVDLVVLLSHDGLEVDRKLASLVKGIDVIVAAHTHDPLPQPLKVNNTLIVQAGSHGKYLGRLDLEVTAGKVARYEHKLYPVLSGHIPADPAMEALVNRVHAPFEAMLGETLGVTESLLYRRDTFMGTFDELIVEAIKDAYDPEVVFSPGFRWGTTLLPGDAITMKDVYDLTAITYPDVWTFDLAGGRLKDILEDILDNVFNPDPFLQQGGDFTRLHGVDMVVEAAAPVMKRIREFSIGGKPFDPTRMYKVSAWGGSLYRAGVNVRPGQRPVYEVVADYLRRKKTVRVARPDYLRFV